MNDILDSEAMQECATCGHEWPKDPALDENADRDLVKDANGNLLRDGDAVTLIKDLKVKGSSTTLTAGSKVKKIRLVDGNQNAGHDIDAKVGGMAVLLKSEFVKKA
jgi:protein PhnA